MRPVVGYQTPAALVPLGFSPTGAFAYLYEDVDQGVGGYLWRFVILDLVKDEALVEERWAPESFERITDREQLWEVHGPRFDALLAEHGVVRSEPVLFELPLEISERFYSVRVAALVGGEVTVSMHHTPSSEKELGGLEHHPWLSLPHVEGIYLSPYEPRGAVLLSRLARGFETSPAVLELHLMGAHLEAGFTETGMDPGR